MVASSQYREALVTQLNEAYGRLVYTYTTQLKMAGRLASRNRQIKCAQIILSAISTGGFLGSIIANEIVLTYVGGVFSTILLALNLFVKDFNLAEDIKQHCATSDNLWLIREQYISLLTDFWVLSEDEIVCKRDELQMQTHEVYKVAPKTDAKSYAAAQKALKNDEEQYFTSEEIDKLLPAHLRVKKRADHTTSRITNAVN